MKFGSVCSGIEAASVAWHPLGWKAAWLSEIEPFPSAVLAHHYPGIPNLGDMTALPERILSGEVEAPDLFCGGTPCQAFSVAGLRNSLDDARGNLSLTFVGIANAIDHVRSVRGEQPAIVFWENVPGVLSTKDNAFGCFLAQLCGGSEPLVAPNGWTNAGCVSGPKRTVAWRVLDAQYFGLAQRRKRVFVVASARNDFDPAAVLFEFDGVRRDIAPSREAGQAVAGTFKACASSGGWSNSADHAAAGYMQPVGCEFGPGGGRFTNLNPTLDTRAKDGPIRNQLAGAVIQQTARMVAFGEYSDDGTASAMKARDYKDATDLVAITQFGETAGTLTARHNSSPCADRGMNVVVQPIPFDTTQITSAANYSRPQQGDPRHPLAAGAHAPAIAHVVGALACNTGPNGHDAGNFACNQAVDAGHVLPMAVSYGIRTANTSSNGWGIQEEVTHTLDCAQGIAIAQPMPINTMVALRHEALGEGTGFGIGEAGDPAYTLTKGHSHAVAQPIGCFKGGQGSAAGGIGYDEYVAPTLNAADSGSNRTPALMQGMAVRRLTPVECERLQGFPDGRTRIPNWSGWRKLDDGETPEQCIGLGLEVKQNKKTGKWRVKDVDGPRYKALGNSWAVPNVRWIGQRIQDHLAGLP